MHLILEILGYVKFYWNIPGATELKAWRLNPVDLQMDPKFQVTALYPPAELTDISLKSRRLYAVVNYAFVLGYLMIIYLLL